MEGQVGTLLSEIHPNIMIERGYPMNHRGVFTAICCLSALGLLWPSEVQAQEAKQPTAELSDQRMADSPEALIKALNEVSFLTPEQM